MVRVARGLLAALVLVCVVGVFRVDANPLVTVQALVQDPNRYDGKVVTVVGTIATYQERASDSGHPYTVFRLRDGYASVTVFTWNRYRLGNGDKVRVTGTFARARPVGTVSSDNEIQAHRVEIVP
jgi:hypothetical protein